ncbi:MAG: sigma-54 dependent transcriptional regulator [Puniceicoccales bacterium]|jgi:DNA-binding NtrC family response regulator|nr:sigma-54 dependent transcriptional regulator [Puniceicoccales bacterium]
MPLLSLLVVDDEKYTRDALVKLLGTKYDVFVASGVDEALSYLKSHKFCAVLTDLRMGASSGMNVVEQCVVGGIPSIVMTAYGDVETAVLAIKNGAFDFITKPIDLPKLDVLLKQAIKYKSTETITIEPSQARPSIICAEDSPFMSIALKAKKLANNRVNVLITGETGTGKEIIAGVIHFSGHRKTKPFVPVHCASLSSSLLESELFGHEKGAFTGATARHMGRFEKANGGTLFLDEIGEIDMQTQIKLLRFLETRSFERVGGSDQLSVDVRVVCATNRDLQVMVAEGKFREDLYYRLNVVELRLPPLRERKMDIPKLVEHYVGLFAKENNLKVSVSLEVMELFISYSWPGNVRELRNVCESAVVLLPEDRNVVMACDLDSRYC